MTEPKFTPGPWHVSGRFSANAQGPVTPNTKVAVTSPYGWTQEQQAANAHLIAAAPELYEALEQVLSVFGSRSQDLYELTRHIQGASEARERDKSMALAAYAALAKARGEQ